MNNYLGKEFHRKSALDANKDDKRQANARLHEATGNQTLQEWFNKEKKKPAPKSEDASETHVVCKNCGHYGNAHTEQVGSKGKRECAICGCKNFQPKESK